MAHLGGFGLNVTAMLALGIALCLYFVGLVVYRLFFHPLAKFPGPKLAAVSRWYEAYYDLVRGGQYTFKIEEMHKRYGPVIRISPFELHVSDPDFYEKLYKQTGRWDKPLWTYQSQGAPGSGFVAPLHEVHRQRRSALNPFFSKAKILAFEPVVREQIEKLSKRIDKHAGTGQLLHLGFAYGALTMDVVTEYAMEKSYGNLDQADYNQHLTNCVLGSGPVWRWGKHLPWIMPLFAQAPRWVIHKLDPNASQWQAFREDCLSRTQAIVDADKAGYIHEKSHKTVFYEILNSPTLPPAEKEVHRIRDEVQTVVAAGLETAAHIFRVITYHVYSNPQMLHRLREELKTLPINESDENPTNDDNEYSNRNWSWRQLEQLPYLTGVINEALRISPGIATRSPRIAPDRELECGEYTIPRGHPVGMTTLLMHHDESIYPNPTAFDPERWTDPEKKKRLEKYFAPFSRGTRNCLGMNLAWSELYLTVAMVVSRYDFQLIGTQLGDVECGSDQFVIGTKAHNGLKVLVEKVRDW